MSNTQIHICAWQITQCLFAFCAYTAIKIDSILSAIKLFILIYLWCSKIGLEINNFYNFRENSGKFVNFDEMSPNFYPREIVYTSQSLRNISRKSVYCYHFQEMKISFQTLSETTCACPVPKLPFSTSALNQYKSGECVFIFLNVWLLITARHLSWEEMMLHKPYGR